MSVGPHLKPTDPNDLQVTQDARNFIHLAPRAPFAPQTRTEPTGQKTEAQMVDHPVGSPVMDGPDFQIALEFAERFFHVHQPLVVSQHLRARTQLDRFIDVQQIPPVLLGFLVDQVSFAGPLQVPLLIRTIGTLFVRLELLQAPSHLAGQLLHIHFLAPDGGQPV